MCQVDLILLKKRQPLTPSRRQHDKVDDEGLVINVESRFTQQTPFFWEKRRVYVSSSV